MHRRDTHPDIESLQIELLREMPAGRKFELTAKKRFSASAFVLAGLRHRYPDESPESLRRRLADFLLGEELAASEYGPLGAADEERS